VVSANEIWILERGDEVIQRRATPGSGSLNPLDRLIYCLWVADYGMRNAGDLDAAEELCPGFQVTALEAARELSLSHCHEAFSLPRGDFEARYFEFFDALCEEIKSALL